MSHRWEKDHWVIDYRPNGRYGVRSRRKLPTDIGWSQSQYVAELEASLKAAARSGRTIQKVLPANISVAGLFEDYLLWYKDHRAKTTHADLKLIYFAHIARILGQTPVESLGVEHFDLYQRLRKGERVSNRTINKELDYFGAFLTWCRIHKKLDRPAIQYEKLPYRRPLPIVLSFDEVVKIIDAAEPFYKAFFLCLYSLGLRMHEARYLKQQDIDMENRTVRVIQKGGSYKILPLNDWVLSAIQALGDRQPEQFIFASPRAKESEEPIHYVRKAIERARKKAGIAKKVTPHLFRHSVATHFIGEGMNLRLIQKYLGHAQVSTTEIYTHVTMDHLRQASKQAFQKMSSRDDG